MIVSASYKTDIPAFYGAWFMNRLEAGGCRMVNPYGGQLHTVPLDRASVDGFVFWTRNIAPFLDNLRQVSRLSYPFMVHYTVTGYPRELDQGTIEPARALGHVRALAETYGRRTVVWRYDPVVVASPTPPRWHLDNFARLADGLAGAVDEVVVSFAQVYRKTARNMAAAARAFGFEWRDPEPGEKRELLAGLAAIAAERSIKPTLCGQPELAVEGMGVARCIDAERLGEVAGRPLAVPHKPHREDCACWSSRDIGGYDTCPHGCVYCYAVNSRTLAKRRFAEHDPHSEFLFPPKQNQ